MYVYGLTQLYNIHTLMEAGYKNAGTKSESSLQAA